MRGWKHHSMLTAILAGLTLLWLGALLPSPGSFAFLRGARFNDLVLSHLPEAAFVRYSIREWGQIPLWNPTMLSGAPLLTDPLLGSWYPPQWPAILFPTALSFNILLYLHLLWAAIGMALFSRAEGRSLPGALLAGALFSGAPKMIAHIGMGHVGLISAVSWTPWLLLSVRKGLASAERGWSMIAAGARHGVLLGVIFLADPRWMPASLALAAAYGLREMFKQAIPSREMLYRAVRQGAAAGVAAAGTAAVLAIPLWQFLAQSTRAGLSLQERAVLALPPRELIGALWPHATQAEWIFYLGAVGAALAAVAIAGKTAGRWFWGAVLALGALFALGEATPFFRVMTAILPGGSSLRVPSRALFLTLFAAAVLAGEGLDLLLRRETGRARAARLAGVGALGAVLAINLSLGGMQALSAGAVVTSVLGLLLIVLAPQGRLTTARLGAAWLILVALDFAWVDFHLLEARAPADVLRAPAIVERRLVPAYGRARWFSPTFSLIRSLSSTQGLELADGVNPLQLRRYVDFMGSAVGFEPDAYSVTLPPLPGGEPDEPWGFQPDPGRLGLLNIEWVLASYPVDAQGLDFVDDEGGLYLYRLRDVRPRAWVEPDGAQGAWAPVEDLRWTPNHIRMRAQGPGLLVLSEMDYPGWRVGVDGAPAQGLRYEGLLRSVLLPAGEHIVEFRFVPVTQFAGLAITLTTMIVFVWTWRRR